MIRRQSGDLGGFREIEKDLKRFYDDLDERERERERWLDLWRFTKISEDFTMICEGERERERAKSS